MDSIHIINKERIMDTLERFYIYREIKSNKQINDKLTVKAKAIYETIVHKDPHRGHPTPVNPDQPFMTQS
jgi:hypothetical protein